MADDDEIYVRDLSGLTLSELTLEDVAYCHLSRRGWEPIKGATVHTTLDDIETEIRQTRGTMITARYLPLLAGFAILEQLGDNYADGSVTKHPKSGGGIERALNYFYGYSAMSADVKALYALRNGLVHAGSLTSTDQSTGERYIFRYQDDLLTAIQQPIAPWDGQLSKLTSSRFTLINPRELTEQVSRAISKVRSLLFDDRANRKISQSNENYILVRHLIWR
ncbi:hypothetical protein [uncultured Sphingomonas sp.]|uniref:hypothetical protein n=1 Tax=uncultured Sphingomonas sp. TaxID=158754 RepID=UPI0026002043|nr:hypothetical protein [uncultured Sphingomonas sp.]